MLFRDRCLSALLVLLVCSVAAGGCATGGSSGASGAVFAGDIEPAEIDTEKRESLNTTDPVGPVSGAPYKTYRLGLEDGDVLRATAESSEFGPVLSIFGPDGRLVATSRRNPAAGASGGDSQPVVRSFDGVDERASVIVSATDAGDYILVVSSKLSGRFGQFSLRTEGIDETIPEFEIPSTLTSYLYPGKSLDDQTGAPRDQYTFEIEEPTGVELEMTSSEFPGHLSIAEADTGRRVATSANSGGNSGSNAGGMGLRGSGNGNAGGNSGETGTSLRTALSPGTYQLSVSSTSADLLGQYRLEARTRDFDLPESFTIGEDFQSFMGLNDERIPGTQRRGEPLEFELEESRFVELTMRSSDIDSYLVLKDESGETIVEDDDSAGNLDSRIEWPLEAGRYTLWASSYEGNTEGNYELESRVTESPEFDENLEIGGSITNMLTADDTRYAPRGTHIRYFELEVEETTNVQIDLQSDNFDTYLVVEDQNGSIVAENDDAPNGMSTNSRVTTELSPGTYRVGVTSYNAGEVGTFDLSVQEVVSTDSSRASLR